MRISSSYRKIVPCDLRAFFWRKEWSAHHKLIGVEKFIIYDNESADNLKEILQPYIDSREVVYIFYAGNYLQFQEKIRNNHYYTKSDEELTNKITKFHKAAQSATNFPELDPNFLLHHEDRIIDKYIPLLNKKERNEK
jgi:hypothetical protein